jgi:Concanavalin A-like lectin/glucanases superfamily
VGTLGAAAGVIMGEPWDGPVLLSLSTGHGIHAGNLAAIPLVALAFLIGRRRSPARCSVGRPIRRALSRRWVGPAAAVVLGVLLLPAAVVDLPHRGSMVPSGGGTIDGAVLFVAGRSASPIGAWSSVAMTYDGSRLRLFVDGHQAASQPTSGTIAAARNPLWLGGNHPFGEFFDGLIDEARVYDRALSDAEIRADMDKPVARGGAVRGRANLVAGSRSAPLRAVGLVAAYAFDEGAGASVADGSGNGNVGTVDGATWTRGRYGSALRFDGAHDLVRVPPSTSLDVGSELTLSAWIRPAASHGGWRTIIYRERDIFFLDAGSDIQGLVGRVDDLLAASGGRGGRVLRSRDGGDSRTLARPATRRLAGGRGDDPHRLRRGCCAAAGHRAGHERRGRLPQADTAPLGPAKAPPMILPRPTRLPVQGEPSPRRPHWLRTAHGASPHVPRR